MTNPTFHIGGNLDKCALFPTHIKQRKAQFCIHALRNGKLMLENQLRRDGVTDTILNVVFMNELRFTKKKGGGLMCSCITSYCLVVMLFHLQKLKRAIMSLNSSGVSSLHWKTHSLPSLCPLCFLPLWTFPRRPGPADDSHVSCLGKQRHPESIVCLQSSQWTHFWPNIYFLHSACRKVVNETLFDTAEPRVKGYPRATVF